MSLGLKPSNPAPVAPKTAEEFKNPATTALRAPQIVVRKLSDPSKTGLRLFLFGPAGSGKSFFIKDLLKNGWKVAVISTDIGGSGMAAVEAPLRREGSEAALENGVDIEIRSFEELDAFLRNPAKFWPEIYDWDPDIIYWDGFGAFQQIEINEYVGGMEGESKKGPSEQRGSGLKLEQSDWGLVMNATIRSLDRFCSLHNRKTGKIWHKLVSAHENIKSVQTGPTTSVLGEAKEPLLSGRGGIMARGAFDLILKTQVRKAKPTEEGDSGGRVFEYCIAGHENLAAKNRGFDFEGKAVIPGNGYLLFTEMLRQRGLSKDQIDEKLKSLQENAPE